jgi:hypothetical protein
MSLEKDFNEVQNILKRAAELIQSMLGGEDVPPPLAKARYESVTKIEEAYMWLANGVMSMQQFEANVAAAAEGMAKDIAEGKPVDLKVVE